MRLGLAIVLGLAVGIGGAWWLAREAPEAMAAKTARAENAAAANAKDARPVLYRWRDDAGNLQVTSLPPNGRKAEKVDLQPRDGIDVRGDR